MTASTLAVDCVTLNFFCLDEPGCFHSIVACLLVWAKCRSYVLSQVTQHNTDSCFPLLQNVRENRDSPPYVPLCCHLLTHPSGTDLMVL
jgi:hypothetical protein